MQYKDYYKILGVKKDDTEAGIKSAYRKLARKFHPDVNKSADAVEKFKDINEAYEVLSDKEKRQRYDTLGSGWKDGATFTPPPDFAGFDFSNFSSGFGPSQDIGGFSDFFSAIFGDLMSQGQGRSHTFRHNFSDFGSGENFAHHGYKQKTADAKAAQKLKNLDVSQNLAITLDDLIAANKSKDVNVSTFEKCLYCGGANGTAGGKTFCTHCVGTGIVKNAKKISVQIPKNVKDGQKIRLKGEGKRDEAGNAGDLYLTIKIQDSEYKISGYDLTKTLKITPDEAVLGIKKEVETPSGKINITIPEKTNTGKLLRLKGMGLKTDKGEFGNLNLKIEIVLPENIDERQIELYKKISELK